MEATDYIQSKNLVHRIRAGQIILQECPFCGDTKGHFYIDQREGVFFCHKCQERGNLTTLKKHFGDQEINGRNISRHKSSGGEIVQAFQGKNVKFNAPGEEIISKGHRTLLDDANALDYVTAERGIGVDIVQRFKLGLETEKNGTKWLMIPHYANGRAVNIKYRTIPPAEKGFRRYPGGQTVLYNQDALEKNPDEIYLTEGEIDCLTLIEKVGENVVGVTAGAGSFNAEWIDLLESVGKIILLYDSDEPGQRGAREAAYRLGFDRCFNVVLPDGQDVNEYFSNHDVSDFQALVQKARPFDVTGIISLNDGLELLKKEGEKPDQAGLNTGFQSVDRLLKSGLKPGELVVVSAPPKIGKTSWVLQLVTWNALQGIPSLFFCMEMRPEKIIHKIVQFHCEEENISERGIENTRNAFQGKPLYFGYAYKKPSTEEILNILKQAIRRYGLKLVAFDHLHFLCRSMTNQTQEISLSVQGFKLLAEEMKIPIILIAQPRKIEDDRSMTAQDLKDSSSIYSDCDHLIILHRNRLSSDRGERKKRDSISPKNGVLVQSFDPLTTVRIEASRYNSGGAALLYFKGECSRFYETDFLD